MDILQHNEWALETASYRKHSTNESSYGIYTVGPKEVKHNMKKIKRMHVDTLLANYVHQFAGLKQQIQQMQYFCKGTVLKRMMKCGQKRCACHKDPTKRHGPYFEWTFKSKGKTVNRRLQPEEAAIYSAATQQYRKLKSLLTGMEVLSRKAVALLAKNARLKDCEKNQP